MIAVIKTNSKVSLNPMLPPAHCPRRLCGYFPHYLEDGVCHGDGRHFIHTIANKLH